jgi:hypothetical protein
MPTFSDLSSSAESGSVFELQGESMIAESTGASLGVVQKKVTG